MQGKPITITGDLGSGKTELGKRLADKLQYEFFSGGKFMRDLAGERGVSMERLGAEMECDDGVIDRQIDDMQREYLAKHHQSVADSRLGWWLAPQSFKVLLVCDPVVAATRIYNEKQTTGARAEENVDTIEDSVRANQRRVESERERYARYYSIKNHMDHNNFDFVIDTTHLTPDEVFERVLAAYDESNS